MENIVFDIPLWQLLGLLSSVVLPLIVGLVTTRLTDGGTKAVLLAALAMVINLLTEMAQAIQTHTQYNLGTALLLGLTTFMFAVGSHFGFWKPTGVAETFQAIGHTDPVDATVHHPPEHRA